MPESVPIQMNMKCLISDKQNEPFHPAPFINSRIADS